MIGYVPYTLLMEILQTYSNTLHHFKHPTPLKKEKLDQTAATNSSTFMTLASEQPPHSKDISTDLDKADNLPLANVSLF